MNNPLVSFIVGLAIGAIAGALVYRKHRDRIELLRAQGQASAQGIKDMFDRAKW